MFDKRFEKLIIGAIVTVLALIGVYYSAPQLPVSDAGTHVYFLDVGQGDATLFKAESGKYVLVDGGPDKKVLSELGEVLPASVHRIDAIVLSHPHADHVTGLDYVLDRYQVGDVYLTGATHTAPEYLEFLKKIKEKNIPAHKTYLGQGFSIDEISLKVLFPESDLAGQTLKDQNDGSVVLDVDAKGQHILMLGDLSAKAQEKYLLSELNGTKAAILKVSHHGSKTGTSQKVLDSIKPGYAVILVGKDNDFGHPAPLTLALLAGIKTIRTDQNGRIDFLISSDGVQIN